MARSVDQIDCDRPNIKRRHGGLDGDAALPLQWQEVGDGAAFVDTADTVDHAGRVEQALGERRLPGVDMRQDAQVEIGAGQPCG